MDDQYTPLQLWESEKTLLRYLNEINTYTKLLTDGLDDYETDDIEILAVDLDDSLTYHSDTFCIGLLEPDQHADAQLVEAKLTAFKHHIINNNLIHIATDIAESEPQISPIQNFLEQQAKKSKHSFVSIEILEIVKPIIHDIRAWAELTCIHENKDLYSIISARPQTAIATINRDPDRDENAQFSRDSADSSKAFRSYFVKEFDNYKIAKINSRYNEIGKQKKEGYIAQIAALTAVLFDRKVLSKTYKATLTFIFDRFGIKEDPTSFKPAQFKRPSIKGTVPATWEENTKFFNSL